MSDLDTRARLIAIVQLADGKLPAISQECKEEAERIARRYREVAGMHPFKRIKHMGEVMDMTKAFYKSYPRPVAARPKG